jgi:2'-5' RNA ligase
LAPSSIELGLDTNFPHVTLLHFAGTQEQARQVWQEFMATTLDVEVDSMGVRSWNNSYVCSAAATHNQELQDLHNALLAIAQKHGLEIISVSGDDFDPHVTLAKFESKPDFALPSRLLPNVPFSATTHLCKMGEHGTAKSLLD